MPRALITGASSGIGEAFARKLAARGYDLILVARRVELLSKLAAELSGNVAIVTADLTTEAGLRKTEEAIGDIDLLVNNAGFGTLRRFWEADIAGQENMHRLHIIATMRLTHAALKQMTLRGHGAIVNVSSVAAFSQSEENVSYCATKAWMNSFTEGLAIELGAIGSAVKVQALCPGFTITGFHETLGIDRAQIPAFLWMKAEDIVDASLRGLDRNKVVVVPGWKYKIAAAAMRHLPWFLRRRAHRPGKGKRA